MGRLPEREILRLMRHSAYTISELSPDRDLVRAARTGDRVAFGELYQRYAPMVHGVLLARVTPDHVDDLLQEVFLKAMTQITHLREDHHFGGWIAAIARNRAADHYRQTLEMQSTEDLACTIATRGTPGSQADARIALAAIQSLPDAYRETLALRLVEGMTGPEIANRTGLTPESVRVNLHRGMKLLRERLGEDQTRVVSRKRDVNHD
jgi:RNA polymerase sigma-70 factor (ECF subfamily)